MTDSMPVCYVWDEKTRQVNKYRIKLDDPDEDGRVVATSPDLQGVVTDGEDRIMALHNAYGAVCDMLGVDPDKAPPKYPDGRNRAYGYWSEEETNWSEKDDEFLRQNTSGKSVPFDWDALMRWHEANP